MRHPNKEIMQKVLDYARKYRAVTAFIVKDDKIIAKEITTVFTEKNSIKHAEINAIESACKKLKNYELKDCWLYTSLEPCPMCASAMCWSKLKGVVFSARGEDRPHNQFYDDWILLSTKEVFEKYKFAPKLIEDFQRDIGKEVLQIEWDSEFLDLMKTKYAKVFKIK